MKTSVTFVQQITSQNQVTSNAISVQNVCTRNQSTIKHHNTYMDKHRIN